MRGISGTTCQKFQSAPSASDSTREKKHRTPRVTRLTHPKAITLLSRVPRVENSRPVFANLLETRPTPAIVERILMKFASESRELVTCRSRSVGAHVKHSGTMIGRVWIKCPTCVLVICNKSYDYFYRVLRHCWRMRMFARLLVRAMRAFRVK